MFRDYPVQFFLEFLDFANSYFHVACLALGTAHGLVYHHPGMTKSEAFAFFSGNQKHGGHGGGNACTDGCHIAGDILHGVVYSQTCVNRAAG